MLEAARHHAGDLVVVEGERDQRAQAAEHAVVQVLDVVVGQDAAKERHCWLSDSTGYLACTDASRRRQPPCVGKNCSSRKHVSVLGIIW